MSKFRLKDVRIKDFETPDIGEQDGCSLSTWAKWVNQPESEKFIEILEKKENNLPEKVANICRLSIRGLQTRALQDLKRIYKLIFPAHILQAKLTRKNIIRAQKTEFVEIHNEFRRQNKEEGKIWPISTK